MKKTLILLTAAILNAAMGAVCAYVCAILFINVVNDGYGAALWAAVAILFLLCAAVVAVNAVLLKVSAQKGLHYILLCAPLFLAGLCAAGIFLFSGLKQI